MHIQYMHVYLYIDIHVLHVLQDFFLFYVISALEPNIGVSFHPMLDYTVFFVHSNYIYSGSPTVCTDTLHGLIIRFLFEASLHYSSFYA